MKLVIIGGVAGGASAAARARRLNEEAQIVLFERGEFVSFANCGLPYHLGNVIADRSRLIVMTPERLRSRAGLEVRIRHEVTAINRARKTVTVQDLASGAVSEEAYDKLIIATGASPLRPPLPGGDDPDVMQLWNIPDLDRIVARLKAGATRAVVVGAGFVGIEVAENLRERGLAVDVVELLPQVLPTLDPEMAQPLRAELERHGVRLHLGRRVTGIHRPAGEETAGRELRVALDDGSELATDLVLLCVGVRPNSELAVAAGLEVSARQGIVVNEHLQTADPDIYAVGDVIAVRDVLGEPAQIPLAGPANRQGRLAADHIFGRDARYRGSLGTAVVKVFGLTAASAGVTEKRLRTANQPYHKVYLHPFSNATYYPGAEAFALKLLFAPDGRILGVQAVGGKGVDKRLDVIATAMGAGLTVHDLAHLELGYAPPYGSAKDPVNYAGMVAGNVLCGDSRVVHADAVPADALLLDVREPDEYQAGHLPGATLIPLGQLRQRLDELPRDRRLVVYCRVGLRGYLAERLLRLRGFDAANLSGGWLTWKLFHPEPVSAGTRALPPAPPAPLPPPPPSAAPEAQLDVSGLQCPGPVVQLRQALDALAPGATLRLTAAPEFEPDLRTWCAAAGHELLETTVANGRLTARLCKLAAPSATAPVAGAVTPAANRAAIVVFSGDLDRVLAAFIIATGLATLGTRVTLFFTFWGLNALRLDQPPPVAKDLLSRMFGWMLPRGARRLALSKLHMAGLGTAMMRHVMREKHVPSLPELMTSARELGVRFVACDMAMNVMGLKREELVPVDEVAGVAAFAALARDSGTVLFV